jgi:pectate lyase
MGMGKKVAVRLRNTTIAAGLGLLCFVTACGVSGDISRGVAPPGAGGAAGQQAGQAEPSGQQAGQQAGQAPQSAQPGGAGQPGQGIPSPAKAPANLPLWARETLTSNDGWAAAAGGTTGGSKAADDRIFVATNRAELVKALAGSAAKIVLVQGTINLSVDDNNHPMEEKDYRDPQYDFETYLKEYDPNTWGKKPIAGPLEEARQRSSKNQLRRAVISMSSNTTLAGIGGDAKIVGGMLALDKVDNVIIRHIEFQDAFDYFPQWDPNDLDGRWNSALDNISVANSTHIWVDHCTFSDGKRTDDTSSEYFGTLYQHHDGLLDITNGSNEVTASYNIFRDHDKVMLIGSSDSKTSDQDHLKVTLHHNLFDNVGQRTPRVRYGQVHVYNNLYRFSKGEYHSSVVAGYASHIYSENNIFEVPDKVEKKAFGMEKTAVLFDTDSLVNGKPAGEVSGIQLSEKADWKPELHGKVDPAVDVAKVVGQQAGAAAGIGTSGK